MFFPHNNQITFAAAVQRSIIPPCRRYEVYVVLNFTMQSIQTGLPERLSTNLNGSFLGFVYFPNCWRRFAFSSISTCRKAFSGEITYDERPNEERTSRADSCMLWLIKLRNVTFSILYITYLFFNLMKIILIHKYYLCNYRCKVTYYF